MENNNKFKALFIMSFLFCSVCGNIFAITATPNEDLTIEPSINKFDIESSNEDNIWRLKYQNIDFDGNYISDGLDAKLQNLANYNTNLISVEKPKFSEIFGEIRSNQKLINKEENIDVIIRSPEKNFNKVLNLFEENEGVVKSNFSPFLNAFGGSISLAQFEAYREMLLQSNVLFFIEEDVIVNSQLYYTGKNMNLRPYVWNTLGYDGDETSALAIIDTGIDESHVMHSGYTDGDYSSKVVGWRDETSLDIQSAPYDDNGHGSHCSGISTGMGTPTLDGLGRTVATNGLNLDLPGFDIPVQDIEVPITKFNVTDSGVIDIYCQFDDTTAGLDFVYGYAYLYYQGIEKDSYEVDLASWTTTLTYDVPSDELGEYNINLGLSLRDGNSDGYTTNLNISNRFEAHWNFNEDLMGSGNAWRGVANDTHLVGVKALDKFGSGFTTDIIAGVNWVIANKEIYNITAISMSLGGPSTSTMVDAVNNAVEEGIVVVCSAGNDGSGGNFIGSPGNADNVISVAAMNVNDETTDYSSQGGSSYSGATIKPDITAPGGSVLALQMFSTDTNDNDVSGIYTDSYSNDLMGAQGTSMSCPAVAGAVNLLIEAMGGRDSWLYTAEQAKKVKSLILMTATETYPLIRELESSGTSPLLNRGTKDVHEGYGRINIDMALEAYTQQIEYDTPVSVSIASSLINPAQKHGFGRYMDMASGVPYAIMLDIPFDADFDLYIYNDDPTTTGDPVLDDSGISSTIGQDESVTFIPSETGRYYLVVKAISGEGIAELTVGEVPLTEPSNVQAIPGDEQVELTWGAPISDGGSAITGYNIYRGTSSGSLSFLTSVGDVLTYTDLGLTNGQIYYYQISAVNVEGEGPLCDEVIAIPSNLPSAPQNLQAISGDAQVELTWGAPLSDGGSAITGYNIYRGTSSGSLSFFTSVGDVLTYTDSGLTNGQIYYYQISANNTEGEGLLCNEVSATPIYDLLGEAVDNYELSFTTGGDAEWFSQTTTTYYGGDAVESGNIDDDQSTWIETTVNGAGTLQFWYSVSSEGGYDYLDVNIDGGSSVLSISGEVPFTEFAQAIPAGEHTIRWTYSKEYMISSGSDCAWIDYINWIPDSPFPSTPQNLLAIPGDAQVELSWDSPLSAGDSAISGYNIYRGTSSGSLSFLTSVGDVLTYTDTGLTNGQIYYYQLSAINAEGEGPLCDEVSATPSNLPSAPQNLQTIPGDAQVELTWGAPLSDGGSAITGYNIYRGTSSGSLSFFTSVGDVLTYTDSGLTNGQIYYYQLSVINVEGEGPLCDEMSATPNLDLLGEAVDNYELSFTTGGDADWFSQTATAYYGGDAVESGNIDNDQSTWIETTVNGAGSLQFWYSVSSESGWDYLRLSIDGGSSVLSISGSVPFTEFTQAISEGEHTIRWTYSKDGSVSSGSDCAWIDYIHWIPDSPFPSAPQNLQVIPGDEQVELTWGAPLSDGGSAITGYNIYRGTSSGSLSFFTSVGDVLTYTDLGLTNGLIYYYQISAINAEGEGPLCDEVSATPLGVPNMPQNLQAIPGDEQVDLTWDAPLSDGGSAITGYKIYRGSSSGSLSLFITVGDVFTYTDLGLTNEQIYYYQISAINAEGEGPLCDEVSAFPSLFPSTPQNIQAIPGVEQVDLTWDAPLSDGGSAITGYNIYRGTSSGSLLFLTSVGDVLTYTDLGLTNEQIYYYQISANNTEGEGPLCDEVSAMPSIFPSSPQNLQVIPGDAQVELIWGAPLSDGASAITGYNIYRGTSSGSLSLFTSVGDVLTYIDTGLNDGQTYYYQISANNTEGEGSLCDEVSVTTDPNVAPNNPINPNPENKELIGTLETNISVLVSDPNGDQLTVTFYNAITGDIIGSQENVDSNTTVVVEWVGLVDGETYQWYVVVDDGYLNRTSETWTFTVEIPADNLTIYIITGSSIAVGSSIALIFIIRSRKRRL